MNKGFDDSTVLLLFSLITMQYNQFQNLANVSAIYSIWIKDFDWLKTRCTVMSNLLFTGVSISTTNKPHLLKNRKLIELKKTCCGSRRISGWDKTNCFILMTNPSVIINSRIAWSSLGVFSLFLLMNKLCFSLCLSQEIKPHSSDIFNHGQMNSDDLSLN